MPSTSNRPAARATGTVALAIEVPGSSIAAIGFALAIYLYELARMSSFQMVGNSDEMSIAAGLLTTLTALALGLAYLRRPRLRLHRHTGLILAIAATFMAAILMSLNASLVVVGADMATGLRLASRILALLLMALWMESVLNLSARNAATLFSVSFIVLGAVNLLTCFLREMSSSLVVATFPMISAICLCWFKDRMELFYETGAGRDPDGRHFAVDGTLLPAKSPRQGAVSFLHFMQPLALCPVAYGFIHYSWVPSQDGASGSMLIQASAAVGTVLGGVLLLALTSHFWGRRKLAMYNLFTMLVLMFAMTLVNMPGSTVPYPYIALLNVAQKITFFFVLMTPFLIPSQSSPLGMWCLGFAIYQTGKTISNAMCMLMEGPAYHVAVLVDLFVSASCVAVGTVIDQGRGAFEQEGGKEGTGGGDPKEEDGESGRAPDGSAGATRPPSLENTCHEIARELMLTRREEDVLVLAARRKAAHEIAEELVIGDSTAKTHLRNLYVKLGVHSKAELVAFVEEYQKKGR